MDKNEMAQILAILRANYTNVKIDKPEAMVKTWMLTLGEFEAAAVRRSAELHMATSKYFPTPAELRNNIVRSKITLEAPKVTALPIPKTDKASEDYYLDELCKFVGLGCEPQDDADLIFKNFLPYEK